MMFNSIERQKQQFDKARVNAWTAMLYDIWGEDVDTIRQKLLYIANDRFIWSKEVEDYIDYEVIKLMN